MKLKLSTNRLIAVITALSTLFSVIYIPFAVSANTNEKWVKQASRATSGSVHKYTNFDWSNLGENLIPDPTVAHFENGVYGKYATPDSNWKPTNINPYYCWDKYLEESYGFTMYYQDMQDGKLDKKVGNTSYTNGFQSAANRSMAKTTGSLTADGSGVLQTSSSGGFRAVALPKLEAETYYVIKFQMKCASAMSTSIELCLEPNKSTTDLGTSVSSVNLGAGFAAGKADTVVYVLYTGAKAYENAFVKTYCMNNILVYFDDFGLYKVTEEYANKCANGSKLPEPEADPTTVAKALNINDNTITNKVVYDFSTVNWSGFGKNLIPDPKVSHFDDGVYGKYAVPDANYEPTEINNYYWWDKYSDKYNGFTMYYQDMADNGIMDKTVNGVSYSVVYRSPNNFANCVISTDSLTDDGTGVITNQSSGGKRYYPLPKMEARSYYIIKFNMKVDKNSWDPNAAFGIDLDTSTNVLSISPKQTANNKIHTFVAVVYTGKKEYKDPYFWFQLWNQRVYIDDVAMYLLDTESGEKTFQTGKVVEPIPQMPTAQEVYQTSYNFKGNLFDYSTLKWGLLGSNQITGEDANKKEITTQSGQDIKYLLPDMDKYSYYLVRVRAKFKNANNTNDFDFYANDSLIKGQLFDLSKIGDKENYITYIVYTGKNDFKNPYMKFWLEKDNSVVLDEFGLYKLKISYGQMCLDERRVLPLSIVNTAPVAVETAGIKDFDFTSTDNIYTDGSFENDAEAVSVKNAKFGNKVLNVVAEKEFDITLETASYYLISAWVRADANNKTVKFALTEKDSAVEVLSSDIKAKTTWNKVTLILYTSDITKYILSVIADDNVYLDGISVIKLPQAVSLACYAMDSYVEDSYDPDRLEVAADIFGVEGNDYANLMSPYYSKLNGKSSYRDVYLKYLDLCTRLGNISEGYAPTGYGDRALHKNITTKSQYNIITDGGFSNKNYWLGSDTQGKDNVTITNKYSVSGTSLEFTGGKDPDGKAVVYKKRITNLKPNTFYYLRISGMGLGDVISDADFGFMDVENGLELRNPPDASRLDEAIYVNAFHQRINFQCQDGTWYTRVYRFNTGENTELDFFLRASKGTVYYDDIMIFEQANAYTISTDDKIEEMAVLSYEEEAFACDEKDNLIKNGDFSKGNVFWKDFRGMNEFVEVAKSKGNRMLHFKGNNMAYYYLPWVEVKANVIYTFSFWKKNLNGENSRSLVVSEYNPHGYASQVHSVSENYGEWELVSVRFICHEDNRIALGIQNLDGEAVFDKVRLFESKNGYEVSEAKDMPIGGDTFEYTILGTDGVTKVEKPQDSVGDNTSVPESDEIIDDQDTEIEEIVDDNSEEEVKKVVSKKRKKIIRRSNNYLVPIIICSVAAVVLVAGGIIFFIFLKKKRKKTNS